MPYINIILGLVYTIVSDLYKSQTEKGCGVATQRNCFLWGNSWKQWGKRTWCVSYTPDWGQIRCCLDRTFADALSRLGLSSYIAVINHSQAKGGVIPIDLKHHGFVRHAASTVVLLSQQEMPYWKPWKMGTSGRHYQWALCAISVNWLGN